MNWGREKGSVWSYGLFFNFLRLLYGPRERRGLSELERALGRTLRRVNPPTPEEVLEAKWHHLLARLARVPEKDYRLYQDFAARLFAEGRVEVVAALMALLLGGAPRRRASSPGRRAGAPTRPRGRGFPCPGWWPFSRSRASRWARWPRPRGAFTWTSAPRPGRRWPVSGWSPPGGWRAFWRPLPAPGARSGRDPTPGWLGPAWGSIKPRLLREGGLRPWCARRDSNPRPRA